MKCGNIAAFLDRDGVITELENYNEGNKVKFILEKKDVKLISGSVEAIKLLNKNKIKTIITSNQPAIARGLITEEKMKLIENYLRDLLKKEKAIINASYFCPHHPTKGINKYGIECDCRKPKPGLILKAAREHNIDLKKSYIIGDRISDIKAGNLAGCKTIGVETGYSCNDGFNDATPDFKVKNIYEAAKLIISEAKRI